MTRFRMVFLVVVSCFLISCDQLGKSGDVAQLRNDLNELRSQMSSFDSQVARISGKVELQELLRDINRTATFDPSEPRGGFDKVESSSGFFLVSLQNVQPYLDGQRVTLHIGNPLSVTYSGFKIKATWSTRMPKFNAADKSFAEKQKAWAVAKQQKEIALTQDLRPGAWNTVSFVVAPAKAEEFGYLEIGIETNQVKLFGGR